MKRLLTDGLAPGELTDLIKQLGGTEKTFEFLKERQKAMEAEPAAEPTQGDASDLTPEQWQAQVAKNKAGTK